MLEFLQLCLATWRIARLLVWEDGPLELIAQLRDRAGVKYDAHHQPYADPDNLWGGLLACTACASVWLAPFMLLGRKYWTPLLAISGGAMLLERLFNVRHIR